MHQSISTVPILNPCPQADPRALALFEKTVLLIEKDVDFFVSGLTSILIKAYTRQTSLR